MDWVRPSLIVHTSLLPPRKVENHSPCGLPRSAGAVDVNFTRPPSLLSRLAFRLPPSDNRVPCSSRARSRVIQRSPFSQHQCSPRATPPLGQGYVDATVAQARTSSCYTPHGPPSYRHTPGRRRLICARQDVPAFSAIGVIAVRVRCRASQTHPRLPPGGRLLPCGPRST